MICQDPQGPQCMCERATAGLTVNADPFQSSLSSRNGTICTGVVSGATSFAVTPTDNMWAWRLAFWVMVLASAFELGMMLS